MKGKGKILFAMFFMQFVLSAGGSVFGPILASIEAAMPNVDQTLISMLASLPTLTMIPTNLLSGNLAAKISKKTLFYIGAVIFLIGGFIPLFTDNIYIMLAGRAVLGFGMGFVYPLGFAMLHDYFEGQALQTASGIFNSGGLVLAIPISLLSGIIGATNWKNTLWMYLFTLVPILLVMTLIPEVKQPVITQDKQSNAFVKPPHPSTYFIALGRLVFFVGITVITLTSSYYLATILPLAQAGRVAGLGSAIFSAGGIVASLLYGKFNALFGRWLGGFAFTIGAIALLLLGLFPSAGMILISMTLCGITMGLTGSLTVMDAIRRSPWSASMTTAICMVGTNLGQFLCPYAVALFSALGGGSYSTVYIFGGILVTLVAAYYWVQAIKPNKEQTKYA